MGYHLERAALTSEDGAIDEGKEFVSFAKGISRA
jgi:hypothetical protein